METDVIIAVMGLTGVGKSTFIKTLTGRQDIMIGHGLTSETSEVRSYPFRDGQKTYVLVDTPGFDDTFQSDDIITAKILAWLQNSYRLGKRLNGIIYLHNISAPKLQGSGYSHLQMFRKLCGNEAWKNIVLATTFWNGVDPIVGQRKETELVEDPKFWGRMVAKGVKVGKLHLGWDSALWVLRQTANYEKVTLKVQQDMDQPNTLQYDGNMPGTVQTPPKGNAPSIDFHSANVRRWKKEAEERERKLEAMRKHMNDQTEILEQMKKENEEERSIIDEKVKEKERLLKGHKCKCRLSGRPWCAGCNRLVSRQGKIFYHCCFCTIDGAFLHCANCGSKCAGAGHPPMQRQKSYCIVM